jgi:hypothetical protein
MCGERIFSQGSASVTVFIVIITNTPT